MKNFKDIANKLDLPLGNLENQHTCPYCDDVGYVIDGDKMVECGCRKAKEIKRRQKKAGIPPHLENIFFADFDLCFYSTADRGDNKSTYRDNAKAILEAAKKFTTDVSQGVTRDGMLLLGNVGCGKTFLAAAIANELIYNNIDVRFIVVPDFLDELRYSFDSNSADNEFDLMKMVKTAPVLVLDDLGAHNYTEWSIKTLFSIINYRVNYELPMIITTNLSPESIEDLIGSRICSRLMESCGFYQIRCSYDIRNAKKKRARLNR